MVTFRENTEDIYTGIEYPAGSLQAQAWLQSFRAAMPEDYAKIAHPEQSGIGIKPISKPNSQRLVRAAIRWALANQRKRLSLVHKGNIMKYTEGAFRTWGYEVADVEFTEETFSQQRYQAILKAEGAATAEAVKAQARADGKLWVDDVIADVTFEQLITRPQNFDVIATTNLNGDYISDAIAALAGGVGISPGANINYESGVAVFEANHGSADGLAGQNKANPSSLILSAEMMLRFLDWNEAADLIDRALRRHHPRQASDLRPGRPNPRRSNFGHARIRGCHYSTDSGIVRYPMQNYPKENFKQTLFCGKKFYQFYSLSKLSASTQTGLELLPYSIRILLESCLRHQGDGGYTCGTG